MLDTRGPKKTNIDGHNNKKQNLDLHFQMKLTNIKETKARLT